jgi:hypothetical protein
MTSDQCCVGGLKRQSDIHTFRGRSFSPAPLVGRMVRIVDNRAYSIKNPSRRFLASRSRIRIELSFYMSVYFGFLREETPMNFCHWPIFKTEIDLSDSDGPI